MVTEIKMPQLGQTSDEVRLIKWLVKENEEIKRGQPLCEVETDKVSMEMESITDGTVVKLCANPEDIISTGTVIALIKKPRDLKAGVAASKRDEETLKTDRNGKKPFYGAKTEEQVKFKCFGNRSCV